MDLNEWRISDKSFIYNMWIHSSLDLDLDFLYVFYILFCLFFIEFLDWTD